MTGIAARIWAKITARPAQILFAATAVALAGLSFTRIIRQRSPAPLQSEQSDGAVAQLRLGPVISAPRGDLLLVQSDQQNLKLRLCGIDAPEPPQPHSSAAQARVQKLVGQSVQFAPVRQQSDYVIAEVFTGVKPAERRSLGVALVAAGLAYLYPDYLAECPERQALEQAQREAKQQQRGIWATSQPQPWDYRRQAVAQRLNKSYQQWAQQPNPSVKAHLPKIDPSYLRDGMQATQVGLASWYGPVLHGRLTANGERFDQKALTVAHASLPFNSRLKVTNLNNGKSVIVRVNDRHPVQTVSFDLSKAAAQQLGSIQAGVVPVEVEILPP